MPKDRYDDHELRLMTAAADALAAVMEGCAYTDLLYGKWSLLRGDVEQELQARKKERAEMFVSPQRQLYNLARWNAKRGWGFTDDDLSDIAREIPPPPPSPPAPQKPDQEIVQLQARVLEVYLPDGPDGTPGALRTFDELWSLAVEERRAKPFHLFDLWPRMTLELSPGLRHSPGLRWRTIDFGHGWVPHDPKGPKRLGEAPHHLPAELERPHAGVLAAAAHFPLWMKRMDGRSVPYAWLPGYELSGVPHNLGAMRERIVHHPRLSRCHDGTGFLYYAWARVPWEEMAVPVYADTKTDP